MTGGGGRFTAGGGKLRPYIRRWLARRKPLVGEELASSRGGGKTGTIEAIWLKRAHRGPMDRVHDAELVTGHGLSGDANATRTKRQVTLIEADLWDQVRAELGTPELDPALRRANLLVRGLSLAESRGRVLALGPARVLVHGETRPCRLMEDTQPGLQAALEPQWRGGVYAEVLAGGPITIGDEVSWAEES